MGKAYRVVIGTKNGVIKLHSYHSNTRRRAVGKFSPVIGYRALSQNHEERSGHRELATHKTTHLGDERDIQALQT